LPSPSSSSFLVTQRRRSKCCLWSCTATLRILCNAAPQTNKQNKHKKKKCLPGSCVGPAPAAPSSKLAPAPSRLQAPSSLPLQASSKLQARSRSKLAPSSKLALAQRLWSSGDGVRGEVGCR
jgi:hypothetical protein